MDYFKRLIRASVITMEKYEPTRASVLQDAVKISSNENGFGAAPAVREAIERAVWGGRGAADALSRYPDSSCAALREALSRKHGLPKDWFLVGNGLDDVINILGLAVLEPGDEVIIPAATFQVYAGIAEMMGARLVTIPMRGDLSIDAGAIARAANDRTAMIFLCNPNNPTGTTTGREDFEALLARLDSLPAQPLLIADQAYADFVDDGADYPDAAHYLESRRYIVVLRTFSKICGMAGLRVGYAIANPGLLSYLYRVRQPYAVNSLAQAAALASLETESARDFERDARRSILDGRARLEAFLREQGVAYIPSQGNFVFAFCGKTPEELSSIASALARDNILARTLIHREAPSGLRFSIGTPDENERLTASLDAILQKKAEGLR